MVEDYQGKKVIDIKSTSWKNIINNSKQLDKSKDNDTSVKNDFFLSFDSDPKPDL